MFEERQLSDVIMENVDFNDPSGRVAQTHTARLVP